VAALETEKSKNDKPPKEMVEKPKVRSELNSLKSRQEMYQLTLNYQSEATKVLEIDSSNPFFCKTCNCSLKDNQAYFDHFNGKRHNQLLGMNMRVEKVGLDKVKEKLLNMKRKAEQKMTTKKEMMKVAEESSDDE
jgi:hypothetical protein